MPPVAKINDTDLQFTKPSLMLSCITPTTFIPFHLLFVSSDRELLKSQ